MIGQLQYPREMKSTIVIEWYVGVARPTPQLLSLTALNSCFVLCIVHGCEHVSHELNLILFTSEGSDGSEQFELLKQPTETMTSNQPSSQLRQRKKKDVTQNEEVKTNVASMSASVDPTPTDQQQHSNAIDPIRWFSALPPTSLRQSQRYFKQGMSAYTYMRLL